jgi:hypothetical protein
MYRVLRTTRWQSSVVLVRNLTTSEFAQVLRELAEDIERIKAARASVVSAPQVKAA